MREKYNKEFKEESIKLSELNGVSKVAKDLVTLGVNSNMLSRWRREQIINPINAFSGKGTPEQEEIKQLKKQLSDALQERDILKKAIAIFSK